jgi:hypothetical protein
MQLVARWFIRCQWSSGFCERWSQGLSNDTNNLFSVFTSTVYLSDQVVTSFVTVYSFFCRSWTVLFRNGMKPIARVACVRKKNGRLLLTLNQQVHQAASSPMGLDQRRPSSPPPVIVEATEHNKWILKRDDWTMLCCFWSARRSRDGSFAPSSA